MLHFKIMNFREKLNDEQYAVVTAPDGPVLAIAAAGTGKTHTLTHRVAYLVEEMGVNPNNILLLTFTNKAANEMMERASTLLGYSVNLWGGTFHRLANRLLRRHADRLGFRFDYSILDSDDSKKLCKSCAEELGLSGKNFPKADVLLGCFGFASGSCKPLADVATDRFSDSETDISVLDVERVHAKYVQRKKELNSMDFDDMLAFSLKLFQDHPDLCDRYADQFKYVLVDEYQDTNAIQAAWVDLLASRHNNLMVVGDDFQSIYSWRGADFRNIISFPDRYEGCTVVKLEQNYRSTPEILAVANKCIEGNPLQFPKILRAVRPSAERPKMMRVRDGDEQARFVVEQIKQLTRRGTKPSEIAILYRAHYHALEMQLELQRAGFDFQVTSGMRFFEQAHIKDICTVLRLCVNPGDELAFTRLLELLPKVGPKTAIKIWNNLGRHFQATQEMAHLELQSSLPKAAQPYWDQIKPVFMAYGAECLSEDPGEIVHRFSKEFYHEYMVEGFDNWKARQEDVDGLVDYCSKFETVESMLSEMALQTNLDNDGVHNKEVNLGDQIRLSTIHQAKGLEWKAVFILWLSDGMFPSAKSTAEIGGEEEERRLFYVATTRAEDQLYLCVPQVRRKRDGGVIFYDPSRFVQELPLHLLDMQSGFYGGSGHSTYAGGNERTRVERQPREPANPPVVPAPPIQPKVDFSVTKTVIFSRPISDLVFSEGEAEVTHLFTPAVLPGLNRSKRVGISVSGAFFDEKVNHLIPYLTHCDGAQDIEFKVSVKYGLDSVELMRAVSPDLERFFHNNLKEIQRHAVEHEIRLIADDGEPFASPAMLIDRCSKALRIQSPHEIIPCLSGMQHAHQVEYLAGKHLAGMGPLLIGTDGLSVLCCLLGATNCFFVWEKVDEKYATFVWASSVTVESMMLDPTMYQKELDRVEAEIGLVTEWGRRKYAEQAGFGFGRIRHDDDRTCDFPDWKAKMSAYLNA